MQCESLVLCERAGRAVTLSGYRLGDSAEFQHGQCRPAVLICPGGGYLRTSDREAEPVALRFAAQGFHAFVLRYSTLYADQQAMSRDADRHSDSCWPVPLYDLALAMRTLHQQAASWQLDRSRIVLCGFSAGAHLAASLGTQWSSPALQQMSGASAEMLRPAALVLGYGVLDYPEIARWVQGLPADPALMQLCALSNVALFGAAHPTPAQLQAVSPAHQVSALTPPSFLWHTANDGRVPASCSLRFALALAEAGVPYELHLYAEGVHGLALADETTQQHAAQWNPACQGWFSLLVAWLRQRGLTGARECEVD